MRYHQYFQGRWSDLHRHHDLYEDLREIGFHTIRQPPVQYPPVLERKWVKYNKWVKDACLICLPGRSNHAAEIASVYKRIEVPCFIVGVTPTIRSWYPMPNGINDQREAVEGIMPAIKVIEEVVQAIENKRRIPRNRIFLAGHSAGSVMAIMTAVLSSKPFAGVIAHSGAILDTGMIPECRCPETPFLLTHSRDDLIFEWHERFIPMFTTLKEKQYTVYTSIADTAGHCITEKQFQVGKYLIEETLNTVNGRI